MKPLRSLVFVQSVLFVVACSNSPGEGDGGADASNDADASSSTDASSDAPSDAANDAPSSDGGGLGQGDPCDPKNDQCNAGLKCCPGGVVVVDGGGDKCLQATDAGTCPVVP